MEMRPSDLCPYCTLVGIVVTESGRVVFLDHSRSCSRGRGDREYFGASKKPIRLVNDSTTPVTITESVPVGVDRWTCLA